MDCGGAYLKLLPGGDNFDAVKFGGETHYAIMFGPDICGSTKRTHAILHYSKKDTNLLINKDIPVQNDKVSHLYTLVIRADNTFEVLTDNKSVRSGKLDDEFDFLEPKEIKDPAISKPDDWVDKKKIPDPDDIKPKANDDIPEEIPDPDAKKPDDWDDEEDGEWEAPMIDNPDYHGDWSVKRISNPAYKGFWEAKKIDNPEYEDDNAVYKYDDFGFIGFDLWQVKGGTIFDNVIICDDVAAADAFAAKWKALSEVEKEEKKKEEDSKKTDDKKKEDEADDDDDDAEDSKESEDM
jgi:calreticulin